MKQLTQLREDFYNILADFAIVVDKCHKDGVEPSCKEELDKIEQLLTNYLQELLKDDKSPFRSESILEPLRIRNQLRQQLRVKAGLEEKA